MNNDMVLIKKITDRLYYLYQNTYEFAERNDSEPQLNEFYDGVLNGIQIAIGEVFNIAKENTNG